MTSPRKFVEGKLKELLKNDKKAKRIEIEICNYTITKCQENNIKCFWNKKEFKTMYLQKYRSIYQNFKRDETLVNKNPNEVVNCHVWKLAPHIWEPIQKKVDMKRGCMEIHEEESEGLYKCRKCKSMNTTFITLQTKSADEPMTIYITCKNCDNRWKE